MSKQPKIKPKKKEKLYRRRSPLPMIIILLAVFAYCGHKAYTKWMESYKSNEQQIQDIKPIYGKKS